MKVCISSLESFDTKLIVVPVPIKSSSDISFPFMFLITTSNLSLLYSILSKILEVFVLGSILLTYPLSSFTFKVSSKVIKSESEIFITLISAFTDLFWSLVVNVTFVFPSFTPTITLFSILTIFSSSLDIVYSLLVAYSGFITGFIVSFFPLITV